MNLDIFWELIETAKREANGSVEKQTVILINMLKEFDLIDIGEFHELYVQKQNEAYSQLLWEVCEFITCGGGEHNFENFRAWLISRGKEVFTRALENPDSLHEILDPESRQEARYELFSYVASKAYRTKTGGREAPFAGGFYAGTPHGDGLDAGQSIKETFPGLCAKLGECSEEQMVC